MNLTCVPTKRYGTGTGQKAWMCVLDLFYKQRVWGSGSTEKIFSDFNAYDQISWVKFPSLQDCYTFNCMISFVSKK